MEGRALVLIALVAGAIGGPISQDKGRCAKTCTESSRFNYETGKTYEFTYKADTVTALTGAAEEHSSLHIRATADIEVHAPCDFVLKMRDVRLEESDPRDLSSRTLAPNSAEFARALETSPLSFAFQDGRVESLCAATEDPVWVLNIKRGILSAFQNSMEHTEGAHTVHETDVAGNCEAEYSVIENADSSMTVKKSKNLLGCTDRNNHVTAFQATPYKAESSVQSLPLMKSHHDCVQTVSEGVLQTAQCTEKHVFRPFSHQDNGASTSSVQKLELRRHHHGRHHQHHGSSRRTDLLFEHVTPRDGQQMERSAAVDTLRQICEHSDIRPQTAQLFSQLTYNLRQLDTMTLSDLQTQVHDNRVCPTNHGAAKKFFLDAIPMVGTTASVSLIRDLLMNGHVTGMQADQWLPSLAFVAQPTADMIREIRPLLEAPEPKANMVLAVSALTRTFCLQPNSECADNMDVQDMVRLLTSLLGSHCNGDHQQVLMALKALGNLGQGQVVSTLARCAAAKALPIDVRVAALSASRNMPCSQTRRAFLDTFADAEEDAEVRIHAYLAAMACPSKDVISVVRRMLEKEEVNQVGSFVWTHLTNLQETNDPFKAEIKAILADEELSSQFDMDKRKFSRNYEGSVFFDSANTGAKVESNLIWSSKSYVPRSAMLNLTVDLFGHSVNLMEVGGRVEGAEHLIESLFGPNGYFPENAVSTALRRARRSADNDRLDRVHDRFQSEAENQARGSIYMKMFGNELRYMDVDSTTLTNPADNINVLEILLKLANNQEVDFSKSFMFLDSTLCVPTIVGVPMKLSVNGTATVKMALGGKMDVRQAAASPRSMDINGYIKPSGAVEVSSLMSVDAFVARTGLKMVSTLHTSTELNGQVTLQDSQVLLGKLSMPKDKIEIVSVESKFFVVHREQEREQTMLTEGRYTKSVCTGAGLKKSLGVELCGELEYPRPTATSTPYFPLTGPAGFKVFLNKADTHSSYDFEARLQTVRERHSSPIQSQVARLSFNTPGSSVNRELFTDVIVNHMDRTLTANLRSPWKKAVVNGALVNEENLKRAALTLNVDDTHEYSINSDVKVAQRGKKVILTPTLEVSVPGMPVMTARGAVRAVPGDMANAEVTVDNVFAKPLTLKGGYDKEVRKNGLVRYTSNLEVRTDTPLIKASASVDHREGLKRTALDVTYRLTGQRHRLHFNGQMKDAQNRQSYTANLAGDLTSTQFPALNNEVRLSLKQQPRHVSVDADLRYGQDAKTDSKRIVLSHESNFNSKARALNMDHTTKLTWKAMNIDMDSKITHKHSAEELKTNAIINYAPGQKTDLSVHVRQESASPMVLVADAALSYPGRQMSLREKLEEKTSGYAHEMALQWQEGSRLTSTGELIISPNNKYDLRVEVNPPRMPSTVLIGSTSLNMDDFNAEGSVQFSGKKYAASTSYNYVMMESAEAKLDVQYPSRQVTVTSMAKMTPEAGLYEADTTVMWDVKRDNSKKMQVNGQFKQQNDQLEGQLNLIHASRKFNMAFTHEKKNGKYMSHGEATWAPGKTASLDTVAAFIKEGRKAFTMEGSAKLVSPIMYLEHVMVSVEGNNSPRLYTNKMAASWRQQPVVNTVFTVKKLAGWRNIESDLSISLDMIATETIKATVNLNTLDNQLALHTEGSFGDDKVELDVSGSHNLPSSIEASIKAKTPFRAVRRIGASLGHSLRNGQLTSSLKGFVNKNKMDLSVAGKDLSGHNYRDASISMHLKTPFNNFEHISGEGKHTKNGNKFTNNMELSLGSGKTISGALDFIHQIDSQVMLNNGNLRISTPFRNAENLIAKWVHDIRSSNVKVSYEAGVNSQVVKADFTHLKSGSNQVATHLQIETPFEAVRSVIVDGQKTGSEDNTKMAFSVSKNNAALMSVKSDLTLAPKNFDGKVDMKVLNKAFATSASIKADAAPYTGHVDFKWDNNRRVALSGDLAMNNNQMRGNLRFASPFQNYERMLVSVDTSASGEKYTSAASFEYADNKKIELNAAMDKSQGMAMSLSVQSPCPYIRAASLQIDHKQGQALINKVKASYAGDNARMTYDSNFHASSLDDFNADIKLTSSMTEDLIVTLVHKKVGGEYHTDADLQFAPRQKVEVQTVLSASPDMKVELAIKTPFHQLRNLRTSLVHSGEGARFQNRMNFNMLAAGEKTELAAATVVRGLRRITSNLRVNHPRMEPVDLTLNHNMGAGNSHTDLTFGPGKKIDIDVTSGNDKVSFTLKTPFSAITQLKVNGEYKALETLTTKFDISTISYGKTTKLSGHFNKKQLEFLDSLLMLETHDNTMTLLAKHGKFSNDWVSTAAFSYSPEKTIAMELNYNPVEEQASLSFNSPFKGFEDLRLTGNTKSGSYMKYGKVRFNYSDKTIMTEMKVRFGKTMGLNMNVETPCEYIRSMKVNTQLSGSLDNFDASVDLSHNKLAGKVTFDAAIKAALKDINALVTFTSPFSGAENLKLKVNHKEQGSGRFISSLMADYATNKVITLRSQLSLQGLTDMEGQMTLSSPCPTLRSMKMAFKHNGDLKNLKSHFEIQVNEAKKTEMDLALQIADAIRTSFKAALPGTPVENMDFTFSHSGQLNAFQTEAELKYMNGEKISASANFNAQSGVQSRLVLTTPFTEDLTITISHNGDLLNFNHNSKVQYANQHIILKGGAVVNGDIDVQFELDTPYEQVRKAGIVVSHKGSLSKFNSGLRLFLNQEVIDAKLQLAAQNGLNVVFKLQTPFEPVTDITVELSHSGNLRAFTTKAQLTYAPEASMVMQTSFNMNDDVTGRFMIKSPFAAVRDLAISFDHKNIGNGFTQDASVVHNGAQLAQVKNIFKNNPIDGSFVITSPYEMVKEISLTFGQNGEKSNVVLSMNGIITRADMTLKTGSQKKIVLRFQSPIPHANDVTLSASADITANAVFGAVEFNCDDFKGIKAEAEYKTQPELAGRFHIETPFTYMEKHTAAFTYAGAFPDFRAHAELDLMHVGKIQLDSDLATSPAVVGQIKLQTPFRNANEYSIVVNHEGPSDNFKSKVVVASKEHFNMEGNANLKIGYESIGAVSFTSDVSAIKDFSASFNHKGAMDDFATHAEATCSGCGKVEIDTALSATRAEVTLQTPFTNMKKYSVVLTKTGQLNDFKTKIVIASREHFKMESSAQLKLGRQSAGSVSFSSDINAIKDFSASFSHSGEKTQFTSHAEATCTNCGKVVVDAEFAASPLHGDFKLQTPFKNVKQYSVTFNKDGPNSNFKSMINVASQEHFSMELNTYLKTQGAMAGGFAFTSDLSAIKDFSASFSHAATNGQFRSHAEATCSGCGKVELDGDFAMSPAIRGEFKFQSPIKNMKMYTLTFNHDGDLLNFESRAEVKSQEHATLSVNGNLKTVSGLEGGFAFRNTLDRSKNFNIAFDHSGNKQAFRSHAEFNCEGWGAVSADADFRSLPSIVGNFHLATPIPGMENLRLNIKHAGESDNFKSSSEFTYGYNQVIKTSMAVKTTPSVDFNLKFEAPFTQEREIVYTHNKFPGRFTGSATILKNKRSVVHYEVNFDSTSAVQGSLKFQTTCPFVEDIDISFKGNNQPGLFKAESQLSYGTQTIRTEVDLKTKGPFEANFKINTPWQQVKDVELDLTHKSWKRRVITEVMLKHNGQSYETKMNLKFKPNIDGEFSLKTPFRQARDIVLTINHQGDLSDFESSVTVNHNGQQKVNGNVNFKVQPRIAGTVNLKTSFPQMKQLHATFGHSGDLKQFSTHATVSHNGQQLVQGELTAQTYPTIQASAKMVQTAFSSSFRQVSGSVNHDGSLRRFRSQGVANLDGKKIFDGELTFSALSNVQGEMKIRTPGNNVLAVLSHDGSLSHFTSSASVTHNGEKKFNTEMTFAVQPTIKGSMKMQTPFSSARTIDASFSHSGSLSQFATVASVSHNGAEKFNSKLSFRATPSVEAKFDLVTPFSAIRQFSAVASHTGNLNKFTTTAQSTYNGQQALDAEVSLETSPVLKANFKLETPHTKLQDAGINVKYEGHVMDFVVDASAQYKGQKKVATLVKFQLEGTSLKTQFNLKTPYTPEVNLVYNHEGSLTGFQCHAEVNNMKADLTFAMKAGEVSITLKSPNMDIINFSANAKYSPSTINAELQCIMGKFELDGSYTKKPMAVQLRLATPFEQVREVSLDMSHRGNNRAMFSSLNAKHNGKSVAAFDMDFKNYARTVGNVQFKSIIPYVEKMAVSFRHEMSSNGLKSEASAAYYNKEVSTEANIKFEPKMAGTVVLNTPFNGFKRTSLKFSNLFEQDLINTEAVLRYGAGNEISVNGNFDRKPTGMDVSLSLNTPFRAVRSVGADFKQEGTWSNLKSTAQVELNKQVIKVDNVYREENGKPVEASVTLVTPFRTMEQTSLVLTDTIEGTRHQPRAVFSWANQQMTLAGHYNRQQGRSQQALDGSLTLTTPFTLARQVTVSGTVSKNAAGMNTDVQLNYNGNKVFHTQTNYKNTGNKYTASFTMVQPHPMSTEVEYDGTPADFTAKASLHWDSRYANKKVSTELSHRLEGAKRLVAIRTITATRTTGLKAECEHSAMRFISKMELIWDEANDKKVSYDVSVIARPTRSHRIYEARARLDTPIRSLEASLNHKDNSQVYETALNAKWDAARDTSRQLTLTNTYENTGSSHRHQLVIAHPKMAKDIVLRNEWSMNVNDIIYSGRTEIEYTGDASDTLVMSTLVQDHSGNYSVELGLSHPQSKLDVKMNSHLANTPRTFSAGMGINYMTARRKVTNMSLRGEIEKIRKQLNVELLTPLKKLQLNGKMKEKMNVYSVNVVATEDEENQVSAKLNLDTKAQTVDMKAFFSPKNPKNMMHMYGKYIDGTSLVMEATRHQDGLQVVEGQVEMDLKDKHLLHSKVYWRPDAMEDAWFTTRKTVKQARQDIDMLTKTMQKAFNKESRAKYDHMRRALPDLKPVRGYLHEEARSMSRDLRVTRNEASRMFDNNEFYVKTAYRFSARQVVAARAALAQFEQAVVEFTASVNQAFQVYYNKMAAMTSDAIQKCNELCDVAMAKLSVVTSDARRALRFALNKYDELYTIVLQKCTALCDAVLSKIDSYVEVAMRKGVVYFKQAWSFATEVAVRTQAMIDELIADLMSYPSVRHAYVRVNDLITKATGYMAAGTQRLSDLLSRVNMAAINNAHQVVRAHLETMTSALSRRATHFLETSSQLFNDLHTMVNDYVQRAVLHQHTDSVRRYMQKGLNKVSAAYTKYDVEARTKAFVRDVVMGSVNFVQKNLFYLVDQYLHLDQDKIIEWNPAGGRLEVQAYLPLEAPSVQSVSFVNLASTYRNVRATAMSLVPDFDYSPMDTYYKYKPTSDVSNWLPPFKAHATLAGRQHYMTFDGKHYEFAAPCSYLLARDFIDGNFSMSVNYDGLRTGVSKKSVTVTSGGKEVEIFTDGKVTVDGETPALPTQWAQTQVSLEDSLLKVVDQKGFTVECDLEHDSCTLHVSGWYFGKVAGLFGTYNNEQSDDFTTAEGTKVTSVSQFAASWAVGRRCGRSRNMARTSPTASSQACSKLFHDKASPLRPCFPIVDPVHFEAMCVNDVMETQGAECDIASLYVAECRRQEVPVSLPVSCKAEAADEQFKQDLEEYVGQKF